MKKKALIIGGTLIAEYISGFLLEEGYRVTLIQEDAEIAHMLAKNTGLTVVCADGTLPDILRETNMQNAELSIALMPRDEDNLVASVLCKKLLKIKRTVSVLKDAKKTEFFYAMGVSSVVCEAGSIVNVLEQQAFLDGIATLVPISGGRVSVLEVPISDTAPIVGKKLWEIELEDNVIVGCILRKEESIVPRGDTRILSGDTLILIASDRQKMLAVRQLTGRRY